MSTVARRVLKTAAFGAMCSALLGLSILSLADNVPNSPALSAAVRVANMLELRTQNMVGKLGFAAARIDGDEIVSLHGEETFPMASTYKVPIALALLRRIDRGELDLTTMISVEDADVVLGGPLSTQLVHSGVALSVANLIEFMIIHSDNTATDRCLVHAGGAEAVNAYLADVGVTGISVNRSTAELLNDFYALDVGRDSVPGLLVRAQEMGAEVLAPRADFEADPQDQAAPHSMIALLKLLAKGRAVSPSSTAFLLGAMSRTVTKPERLSLLLPQGTRVLHKTGTVGGVVNDVGYITLPDGELMAIAVYTKSSSTAEALRERAVAEVARTLFDYFSIH